MYEAQRESAKKPLEPWKEWLFGLGTAGSTLCNSIRNTFYFFFLTNVVCMDAALMGKITTISSILGMVLAPVTGVLITKLRFKTGKYFTWSCIVFPFGMILYAMNFINIQASATVQFWYYCTIYVLAIFLTNFNEMGLIGFLPQVCKDKEQAVRASSKRSMAATCGTILHSLVTVSLVALLGKGDLGKGYLYVFIIYAILCVALYQVAGQLVIRPYDFYPCEESSGNNKAEKDAKVDKIPISVYFKAYYQNPAVILYQLCDAFKGMASRMYNACITYYLTYVCEQYELLTYYLLAANVGLLVGSYLAIPFANKFGKKITEICSYGGFGFFLALGYFVGVGNGWWIIAFIFLGRTCSGLNASLLGAIYGDISDNFEYISGYKMNSYYVSMSSLVSGLGMTAMATITATVLANIGYSADAVMTETIKDGLTQLVTLWPGVPLLLSTILFFFYPLNEKRMEEVRKGLQERQLSQVE